MTVRVSTINKNYDRIPNKNPGANFMKVDLHMHTPASGDAAAKNKYNFNFDIKNRDKSLETANNIAGEIIEETIKQGIRLIAVTDHNTPGNVHPEELGKTWYQILKNKLREKAKEKELYVLPGVEISTDDLHILVIFCPREDEPAAYTTHRINFLLRDCKFPIKDYGKYSSTGMASLFDVLECTEDLSTCCITIPAHIDGGRKAMLSIYRKPSNVFRKLLNHPNLNAVEIVDKNAPAKEKVGKKYIEKYFKEVRDESRSSIAYIQNSDSHSIAEIGKRYTYIRMGQPDFWSLRNALENPESRVRLPHIYRPDEGKIRIIGIVFRIGGEWHHIAFNSNLNCIIGKKQTYKSTVIDLILYGLDRFEKETKKDEEAKFTDSKYAVNVFIEKDSDILCYSRDNVESPPSIFKYNNNSFVPTEARTDIELPRKYNHEVIQELFSQRKDFVDFLDRHIFKNEEISPYLDERRKLLKIITDSNFKNCELDIQRLVKVCSELCKKRKKYIKPALSKYKNCFGKKLFEIEIKKGNYNGDKEEDFFDRATMSVLVGSKSKPFEKLSTGQRNAVMMVLLMNQGAFGPLILDEPEQYLDIKSITEMLIPRMRQLKTQQQIICVTRDEQILISGDAEHVIAMQSEKKPKTITGDINNEKIQKQILEVFEGNKTALWEKVRKLGRILE